MEKQLEDKERLFEEQSLEVEENTEFYNSDFADKDFSLDNFIISKTITHSKAKNDVEVTNSPINLIRQSTKKPLVEDKFLSPTS